MQQINYQQDTKFLSLRGGFCVTIVQLWYNELIIIQIANAQLINLCIIVYIYAINLTPYDDDSSDLSTQLINGFHCPKGVFAIALGCNYFDCMTQSFSQTSSINIQRPRQ